MSMLRFASTVVLTGLLPWACVYPPIPAALPNEMTAPPARRARLRDRHSRVRPVLDPFLDAAPPGEGDDAPVADERLDRELAAVVLAGHRVAVRSCVQDRDFARWII